MKLNKRIINWTLSSIFSAIVINLGLTVLREEKYIGIITVLIGFALLYFSDYSFQIRINEKKIKDIDDWIQIKEELLNTLKDIVILKRISKIK